MIEKASKHNNYHYNKSLQPYANKLRKNMTKAEACLWKYVLWAGTMLGYKFRRQRPILNYIADFMCMELMLIIEVDGYSHEFESVYEKDLIKQQDLEAVGFTVLRFRDVDVLAGIGDVIGVLEDFISLKSTP
ncbi:MAG: DUF559 domain-containing protein [Bacteroidales bacterium]|nr:DUF559 domain-containing protein [Bacteroidales bacterium]